MLNQIRYILVFCVALFSSLSAAAQLAMPDSVCIGSAKHYYVDPNPEPGSTYTWRIDGITQVGSTTNAIDITWNTIGTYLLEVQELSGNGCPGAFISGQVMVNSLPAAIAGEDRTICLNESTQIGAENVPGSTYSWSSVPVGFTSTLSNPVVTPLETTTYTVVEIITSSGCSNSNGVVVTVNPEQPVSVSIAASENPVCAGTLVTFTATPTNGGTPPLYQWYVNTVAVGTNSSIYAYVPVTGDQVYVVLTSNATCASGNPATSNEVTMTVNTGPLVSAGPDGVTCQNISFTVKIASVTNASTILWTHNGIGTLTGATTINPVYTPDPQESGIVILTLTAQGLPPCGPASDQMTLTINQQVIANAGDDATVCEHQSYILSNASAQNFSAVTWTTSGTGPFNDPNLLNPTYTPSVTDNLAGYVILTLTANGHPFCDDVIDSMMLTIIRAPVASVGPDLSTCPGESVSVSEASAQNYSSLLWTHNGLGSLSNTTTLTPVYTPTPSEQGSIILTLTVNGMEVCSDTVIQLQLTITIHPLILVNAGSTQSIPAGTSTRLSGQATGSPGPFAFEWQPATLVLDYTTQNPETVILTEPVTFWLTVTDLLTGCKATDSVRINILSSNLPPVAVQDLGSTRMNIPVTVYILKNDYDPDGSITGVTLYRGPDNGLVVLNPDNTITYSPDAGFIGTDSLSYFICDNGLPVLCDTATVYILVRGDSISDRLTIYNVITPNDDGDNDRWIIDGIDHFPDNSVTIFNRWGDKIYDYDRYDNETVVWKGTDRQGHLVPDGTYYYILTIKDGGSWNGWVFIRRGGN